MNTLQSHLPQIVTAIAIALGLWGAHWALLARHQEMGAERQFPRQLMMLAFSLLAVLGWIIVLPIEQELRNRLIGLIGLVVSGMIAFSSTNILANLMSGILLRITKPFKIGDFVRVGEFFGRVTERGLFDTEMQTENRELVSLPNAYLIRQPVTTIPKAGSVVATQLSLGYDVHHKTAEPLLLKAAVNAGLEEPFVHVVELGDYAVGYRVAGFLVEPKQLITARANLCRAILDELHDAGIEIMSPSVMAQRPLPPDKTMIPRNTAKKADAEEPPAETAEELVFDKAEKAEKEENEKTRLSESIHALKAALKEADEAQKAALQAQIERAVNRLARIEKAKAQEESE